MYDSVLSGAISLGVIILAVLVTGCTTIKIPQATGGSKADGIIDLSYQYGGLEKPVVQWDQALITAKQRCGAWGYQNVEAFGGTTSHCQAFNQYGCVRFLVTRKYQCMD